MLQALILLACFSFSSPLSAATPAVRPSTSPSPVTEVAKQKAKLLWKKRLNGFVTDLDISLDGKKILVATAPDREGGRSQRYQLFLYSDLGKKFWDKEIKFPVRTQALTGNGKLVLISDYDDHLFAFNDKGKKAWESDGMCRPITLDLTGRILCFHDEDTAAGLVFEILDAKGNKEKSFPIPAPSPAVAQTSPQINPQNNNDVLVLKVSQDQKYTTFALTGGRIFFLGPNHQTVWEQKVDGEVTDLAVSDGPQPKVSALILKKLANKTQAIQLWDQLGHSMGEITPATRLEQIHLTPDGSGVIGYGNNPKGQILTFYGTSDLKMRWTQSAEPYAEYSAKMSIYSSHVAIAFDDRGGEVRHSHLKFFDFKGGLDWDIPVQTDEGALIAVYDLSTESHTLAVGMDDGQVMVYRLLEDKAAGKRLPL